MLDAALGLARWSEPALDISPYKRHVQTLIQAAQDYIGKDFDDAHIAIEAVRQVIAKRFGYATKTFGDTPQDLLNLARVIERRRGGAWILCLLYAHVLEHLGQQVDIVDFPARPLVRVRCQHEHIILDPLNAAKPLSASQLRPMFKDDQNFSPFAIKTLDKRQVLVQLLDLQKLDGLRHNAPEAAISILEASVLIAPLEPQLWHQLGLLHAHLDHVQESIAALKCFLDLPGRAEFRYSATQLIQQLQSSKDT